MRKRRIIKRATAAAAAVAVISCVHVYAQGNKLTVNDIVNAIHEFDLMTDAAC